MVAPDFTSTKTGARREPSALDALNKSSLNAIPATLDQALLEALPTPIYTTDATGRITYFNTAAATFWGRRPQFGEMWCGSWRLFSSDGTPLPHDQCPMAIAIKENRAVRDVEAIVERPDGHRAPFVPYPTPLHDASGVLIGAVNTLVDISAQKSAAARQRRLINELNHRVKNSLASAQSIVSQTLRGPKGQDEAYTAIEQRLAALARAHDLLSEESWGGAEVCDVVRCVLDGFGGNPSRIRIAGPQIRVNAKTALVLAMAIHELGANALEHGALSNPLGEVSVGWRVESAGQDRRLNIHWREMGGAPVATPLRRGFGTRLIECGLAGELGGEMHLRFEPTGVTCEMWISLADSAEGQRLVGEPEPFSASN
jgi:two-component sensor histidine kinase